MLNMLERRVPRNHEDPYNTCFKTLAYGNNIFKKTWIGTWPIYNQTNSNIWILVLFLILLQPLTTFWVQGLGSKGGLRLSLNHCFQKVHTYILIDLALVNGGPHVRIVKNFDFDDVQGWWNVQPSVFWLPYPSVLTKQPSKIALWYFRAHIKTKNKKHLNSERPTNPNNHVRTKCHLHFPGSLTRANVVGIPGNGLRIFVYERGNVDRHSLAAGRPLTPVGFHRSIDSQPQQSAQAGQNDVLLVDPKPLCEHFQTIRKCELPW